MTETLEKEVVEEEKNAECSLFETHLFNEVYESITESKSELEPIIQKGLLEFLSKKFPEQVIQTDVVMAAFWAGNAIVLGGDFLKHRREEADEFIANQAIKRIIRKENLIGLDVECEENPEGAYTGVVLPREQFEKIKDNEELLFKILAKTSGKTIKSYKIMSDENLDKILEKSADKLLKGEFNE